MQLVKLDIFSATIFEVGFFSFSFSFSKDLQLQNRRHAFVCSPAIDLVSKLVFFFSKSQNSAGSGILMRRLLSWLMCCCGVDSSEIEDDTRDTALRPSHEDPFHSSARPQQQRHISVVEDNAPRVRFTSHVLVLMSPMSSLSNSSGGCDSTGTTSSTTSSLASDMDAPAEATADHHSPPVHDPIEAQPRDVGMTDFLKVFPSSEVSRGLLETRGDIAEEEVDPDSSACLRNNGGSLNRFKIAGRDRRDADHSRSSSQWLMFRSSVARDGGQADGWSLDSSCLQLSQVGSVRIERLIDDTPHTSLQKARRTSSGDRRPPLLRVVRPSARFTVVNTAQPMQVHDANNKRNPLTLPVSSPPVSSAPDDGKSGGDAEEGLSAFDFRICNALPRMQLLRSRFEESASLSSQAVFPMVFSTDSHKGTDSGVAQVSQILSNDAADGDDPFACSDGDEDCEGPQPRLRDAFSPTDHHP